MNVPEQYYISVSQKKKDNKVTVSGYKKNNVITTLRKSIVNGDVSRSIQWAVELHISNYTKELWNVFLSIMSKHIHRENALLPVYMERQLRQHIRQLTEKEPMNNQECRNRITEVTAVLTLSHKCKLPSVKKAELIQSEEYHRHLLAPSMDSITHVWRDDDLPEIRTACNELAYQLSKQDHTADTQSNALYWLHWIIHWDKEETKKWRKKKKKQINPTTQFSSRPNRYTVQEFSTDYIWLVWNIILHAIRERKVNNMNIVGNCLFRLFCRDYKTSKRSKHIMYVQHAMLICLDTIPQIRFTQSVFTQYSVVVQSDININALYADIHKRSIDFQRNRTSSENHYQESEQNQPVYNAPPEHPYFKLFMEEGLYNDPRYQVQPSAKTNDGVLCHLDKFFSIFEG